MTAFFIKTIQQNSKIFQTKNLSATNIQKYRILRLSLLLKGLRNLKKGIWNHQNIQKL